MKDKRQGNDLKVAWSIFNQDGEPFRLDGKDVSLYLKNMFGRKELNDFVTTGNIIQWTFYGKDQKNSGKYSLELVINEGEKGMITTDKCDFVNLVSCSCKLQGGEDAPNVETESIELTSTLEYVAGGGDYDDTALWRALNGKVDKVEGLGLSEENYTTEDKEKLEGLENYDDSGIKEDLAKKAYKSEIPTKMSQLEQDIEIGGEVDLSDYPTREEVSETYLPREEFEERIEGYATNDSVQELSENVTELSAEVSGLSERIDNLPSGESSVFKAVYGTTTIEEVTEAYNAGKVIHCDYDGKCYVLSGFASGQAFFTCVSSTYMFRLELKQDSRWAIATFNYENSSNKTKTINESSTDNQYPSAKAVYDAIQQSGGGASNEWKCVFDGRMEVGEQNLEFTTYADGTPLKAKELIVQVVMDANGTQAMQGYVKVQSTTNKTLSSYGAIYFEKTNIDDIPQFSQIRMMASPMYMVADIIDCAKALIAQGAQYGVRIGNVKPAQIYEDITYVLVNSNGPILSAAPIVKVYAR